MFELAVKSSEVREHFSEVVDSVIHKAPKVVIRRRDSFMMLNMDHLAAIVENVKLHINITQDEQGEFIATFEEIEDMFAAGESKEAAVKSLIQDMIEYSVDYLGDSFQRYFNAPNRKHHLPYVIKTLLHHSPDSLYQLIDAQ